MYEINKSPGDGHCLLHSIISSLFYQLCMNVTMSELIKGIMNDITDRSSDYIDFFNGSLHDLHRDLNSYVKDKKYDSPFGDLVPTIIANAMNPIIDFSFQLLLSLNISTMISSRNRS